MWSPLGPPPPHCVTLWIWAPAAWDVGSGRMTRPTAAAETGWENVMVTLAGEGTSGAAPLGGARPRAVTHWRTWSHTGRGASSGTGSGRVPSWAHPNGLNGSPSSASGATLRMDAVMLGVENIPSMASCCVCVSWGQEFELQGWRWDVRDWDTTTDVSGAPSKVVAAGWMRRAHVRPGGHARSGGGGSMRSTEVTGHDWVGVKVPPMELDHVASEFAGHLNCAGAWRVASPVAPPWSVVTLAPG